MYNYVYFNRLHDFQHRDGWNVVKKISKQCFWSWPLVVLQIVFFFPSLPGMMIMMIQCTMWLIFFRWKNQENSTCSNSCSVMPAQMLDWGTEQYPSNQDVRRYLPTLLNSYLIDRIYTMGLDMLFLVHGNICFIMFPFLSIPSFEMFWGFFCYSYRMAWFPFMFVGL